MEKKTRLVWAIVLVTAHYVSVVLAACPTQSSFRISSQSDADLLQDCITIPGSVTITPSATGTISIPSVQSIGGNLSCSHASFLTALSAPALNTISAHLMLKNLTTLSTLDLGSLIEVQYIDLERLPSLKSLSFPAGLLQINSGVRIVNTFLSELDELEMVWTSTLEIFDNPYLSRISIANLEYIYGFINIVANGIGLGVSLPNLSYILNLTMHGTETITLPSLQTVAGSLDLSSNGFSMVSLSNLTSIGGNLVVDDCPMLDSFSVPLLTEVGSSLQINNNSNLMTVEFERLHKIDEKADINGTFDQVLLPSLQSAQGDFSVRTSSDIDCSELERAKNEGVFKARFSCIGRNTTSTGSGTTQSGSTASNTAISTASTGSSTPSSTSIDGSTSRGSSSLSGGAIGGIVAGVVIVIIIANIFIWFSYAKYKRRKQGGRTGHGNNSNQPSEWPLGEHYDISELPRYEERIDQQGISTAVAPDIRTVLEKYDEQFRR